MAKSKASNKNRTTFDRIWIAPGLAFIFKEEKKNEKVARAAF